MSPEAGEAVAGPFEVATWYAEEARPEAQVSPPAIRTIIEDFLARCDLPPAARALDAGCGRGLNIPVLQRYFASLDAVDLSGPCVDEVKSRYPGVHAQTADVTSLPFESGTFDLVVCSEVLEHVPDLSAAIGELLRVLKSQGYLIITTPNYANVQGLRKMWHDRRLGYSGWDLWEVHSGGYEAFMTPRKLRQALRKNNGGATGIVAVRGVDYHRALGLSHLGVLAVKVPPLRSLLLYGLGRAPLLRYHGIHVCLLVRKITPS